MRKLGAVVMVLPLALASLAASWGNDTAIYFANAASQWVTCPASGCTGTPTVMADASAAIGYLTGDAQAIYWLNTTFSASDGGPRPDSR